jgi:hypothetical protein
MRSMRMNREDRSDQKRDETIGRLEREIEELESEKASLEFDKKQALEGQNYGVMLMLFVIVVLLLGMCSGNSGFWVDDGYVE